MMPVSFLPDAMRILIQRFENVGVGIVHAVLMIGDVLRVITQRTVLRGARVRGYSAVTEKRLMVRILFFVRTRGGMGKSVIIPI